MEYYILEGKDTKKVHDVLEWARMFEESTRIVQQTNIGSVFVSTVFLGLDHAFMGGPPLLFETMVFGGTEDGTQERYHTWEEAEKGHAEICNRIKSKDN